MTILRACVTCGKPSAESHCPEHRRKPWSTSRRQERVGLSGGRWESIRRKVLARDSRHCYLCDKIVGDSEPVEVDHLVPVSEGGSNALFNCATAHKACHRDRHADPERWQERVDAAREVLQP